MGLANNLKAPLRPLVRTGRDLVRRARYAWLEARCDNHLHPTCTISHDVEVYRTTMEAYSNLAHHANVRDSVIGAYSSVGRFSKVTHCRIGRFAAISWDVTLNAGFHPFDRLTVHAFPYRPSVGHFDVESEEQNRPLVVGNDVWIGTNSVIMPGLTVGDGAVIGSSSVVTHDVPPFAIVAGAPARVLRLRFDPATIERLLALRWWELDRDVLSMHVELFQKPLDAAVLRSLETLCESSATRRSTF